MPFVRSHRFSGGAGRNGKSPARIEGGATPIGGVWPSPYAARRRGTRFKSENRMTKPTDKEISARAYELWEKNGRPEGKEKEFWHLAEQELLNEDKSSPLRTPNDL
jgi:hypothetical protein